MKQIKTSSLGCILRHNKSNVDKSPLEIPEELIEVILSKCPVKSLVRFKAVSRSWQSIISSARFSRILSKSLEHQNKFIFSTGKRMDLDLLHVIRLENDVEIRTESMPKYPELSDCNPLCSCDGLMLLLRKHRIVECEHILWNPFIRKYITIPPPKIAGYLHYHMYLDSITDDYKIVCHSSRCYRVYSCKNRSWGEIEGFRSDLLHLTKEFKSYRTVDGCFYHMRENEILCFDTSDGKLYEFHQPDEVKTLARVSLEAVSGRLCLYGFNGDGYHEKLQLWGVEKNGKQRSWKKLISMEKVDFYMRNPRPVCLTSEDDVLLTQESGFIDFMYSRSDCRFRDIYRVSWNYTTLFFPYRENLYMPSSGTC